MNNNQSHAFYGEEWITIRQPVILTDVRIAGRFRDADISLSTGMFISMTNIVSEEK